MGFSEFAAGGDALAFSNGDGGVGGDGGKAVELAAGPVDFDGVGFVALGEAEGEDEFAGGEVTGAAAEHFGLRFATTGELYDGADAVAIRFRADQFEAQAVIGSGALSFFFG